MKWGATRKNKLWNELWVLDEVPVPAPQEPTPPTPPKPPEEEQPVSVSVAILMAYSLIPPKS